ncbi:VWA domain-containing protein [Brevibacillus ruminantium]|uniref:VWA domain-containing protein n=1 Tax=Brevibacillus ruminantium TaxID=2950604 RepID=A0ABY4WM42_9BACL|nr:VWA domain-containing protein [Brevibacillus ruminantium]USG65681.1 VWA domain-containing protein [Brevibacillus ruminantium]
MKMTGRIATAGILICFLVMSACSPQEGGQPPGTETGNENPIASPQTNSNPNQTEPVQTNREEKIKQLQNMIPEGVAKIPTTVEEFAQFPTGIYAGRKLSDEDKEEIEKLLNQFPDIENPDQETINLYFLALLGLFAEDYPDPLDIIDQIKVASFGSPEIDDPRFAVKQNYNVQIILDASGSMAERAGGKTRMEAAKDAIMSFAESLPKEANVALRVYGHKGSGKASDKALSCGSSELVYGMEPYDASKMQDALSKFRPTGYTPIAYALQEAMKDFGGLPGVKNTNIIYLVSDGIETCDGDPVKVAKELASSDITPIVNVIGFGTDRKGQQQLEAVAEAAGGRFVLIQNQEELQRELDQAKEMADKWWRWQFDSSYENFQIHLDQEISILRFGLDWSSKSNNEDYNIFSALNELSYRNTLSEETIAALTKKYQERNKLVNRHGEELENFLNSLNNKTYKEAIETIDNLYKQNVKQ